MDRPRRRAGLRPEVAELESRQLLATTVSVLQVKPHVVRPPNGRIVKVDVSGFVVDSKADLHPSAQYHLIDEYRENDSSGPVKLTRIGRTAYSFQFAVFVKASRASSDTTGRQYHLIVGSSDEESSGGKVLTILVPYIANPNGKKSGHVPGNAGGAGVRHPTFT